MGKASPSFPYLVSVPTKASWSFPYLVSSPMYVHLPLSSPWTLRLAFLIACCPSSIRLSICLSVCKLFIFPSSSPELLGQFQPSLAQSIFGLWNLQIIHITGTHTDIVWFFRHLKWVGSVLSRSELDPFLYILYHTVQTQNRLSPVVKGDSDFFKWRPSPFWGGGGG